YVREDGQRTRDRHARPLALYFWSGVWTLISWCELRDDFRTFRLDRMDGQQVLDRTFALKPASASPIISSVFCRPMPHRVPA
ncbi:MAG TPA: WYL domain-containing protein, partial [Acidobacteriaceae bacterium]|nr:WYL domain-containing protein [Acidobacteriaceae bacterium]